jgi:hypothetical protein
MEWPPKGANLSPIENAWAISQEDIDYTHVNDVDQMWAEIQVAWNQLKENHEYWNELV